MYRNIGGHAYGSVYSGPIGAVLAPLLEGYEELKELPFASSLCGACTDVCPVKIPLHDLLIEHRKDVVEQGFITKFEQLAFKGFTFMASHPFIYEKAIKMAHTGLSIFAKDGYIANGPVH